MSDYDAEAEALALHEALQGPVTPLIVALRVAFEAGRKAGAVEMRERAADACNGPGVRRLCAVLGLKPLPSAARMIRALPTEPGEEASGGAE